MVKPKEQQINAGLLSLKGKMMERIASKGGTPDGTTLNTLADSVNTIPQGMSKLPGGFQLHPDWWDIIKMMDTIKDPAGNKPNVAMLVSDSMEIAYLTNYASTWAYTTDGFVGAPATRTLDWSKGKPCSEGYKTHAILGWGLISAAMSTLVGNNVIVIKTDAINITSYALGGSSSYATALDGIAYTLTKQVRAILCTDKTTANANSLTAYGMSGLRTLERLEIANGATLTGSYTLQGCAVKEVVFPKNLTGSISNTLFDSLNTIRYCKFNGVFRHDCQNLEVWEVYPGETYFTNNPDWIWSYRLSITGLYKLAQDLAPHPRADEGIVYTIKLNTTVFNRLLAAYPDANDIMASKGYAFTS